MAAARRGEGSQGAGMGVGGKSDSKQHGGARYPQKERLGAAVGWLLQRSNTVTGHSGDHSPEIHFPLQQPC